MSSNEIVFGGQGQAPDDVRDAIENERRNALSQSISFATTQDPKRIAESMRYGFGPLVPQQSLDAARRAETARKTYDSILNYPVTSSFFQDPAFASIAISDAPNIGLLENTARTLLAAPIGMANAILPMLEFAQGQASGFVDYLRIKIKQNAWEHMTPEQQRQFKQQDLMRRGKTEYPSEFRPLGEMITTRMRRGFQEATEGLQPQTETILGEALVSAGTSMAQFAALLPLGPAGILAGFGAIEFGHGLEEGRKAGLTPDQQLRYAGFNAASEMGFAAAPLQGLLASVKGGSAFLRSFWQFSAAEIPAEMATTLTQSFNRWAQIDSKQGQSFESWLSTLKREEAVTFLATLISSAGFSALAHRAEAQIATQAREQSLAESRANGLTQMADQFVDLSISEEAPDLARQLVNGIAQESGSVDRLRVDTSRLAEIIDQIGVNRVREVLPGVVEEIQQAGTEPGIEAEISPGDYFVAIKQLPELRAALEPHLRVGDSEYSSSEIEQAQAETQQFLADIEQTFNDLVTEARQRESDRSTIYRDVITQVLGADAANVLAAQEPVAAQELEAEPQPVEQPEADPVAVEAITEAIPPEVSQVVQAMAEQMEEAAPEPAAEVEQAAPEPAQEQAPQPTEQQDFLSWFGTSQARTMAGVPMRLVETSPGIYTQSAEGPSGVAVSIRAPLKLTGGRAKQFLTSEKARKSILAQARRSGNDGVIAYAKTKDESGKSVPNTVYAPLDADQVRAMPQSMDVLFAPPRPTVRITPEQDATYMEAVKSGDTQAQQAAVRALAEQAFPETFVRADLAGAETWKPNYKPKGAIKKMYHGGEGGRVVFGDTMQRPQSGYQQGTLNSQGIWLSPYKGSGQGQFDAASYAANYGDGSVYSFYVNITNPVRLSHLDLDLPENSIENLIERGFDGAQMIESGAWVAFSPNQVKSSDPITRDADGNVIPLSQRFDVTQPSILYAPPTKRGDEYSSWAEEMAAIQRKASGEQPKGALSEVADSAKEWLAGIRKKFAGGVFSDAFTRAERTGDVETGRKLAEAAAMQAGKFVFPANHGLREGILRGAEFDVSLLGKNTGAASAAEGVFTSKGFHTALRYAVPPAKKSAIPVSNESVNVELYKALDNLVYEREDQYGKKMVIGYGHFVRANMSTPAAPIPDIITEYVTEYKKRRRLGPTYEPLITRTMSPVQVAEKLETARSQLVLSASRANPKNASLIREVAKKIQVIINQVNADYDLQPSEISATGYRGVLQLYVIFDNPYIFDQKGELGRATTYYEIIKQAKADGHDGVIIKNTFDGSAVDDVYVAFSPTQMKSAEPFTYDKNGKLIPLQKRFDLSTPSILYGPEAPGPRVTPEQIATQAKLFSMMFSRLAQIMGVRSTDLWSRYGANILAGQLDGLTEQEQAAALQRPGAYLPKKMTVILNQDQTASTLIHELTHHWMHVFETIASDVSNEQADAIRDEFQVLLDWFGVKDINAWQALPASEKAKHHETLTYNFEDYLATGKAPTNALRSVFRKIKDWFAALYTDLRGHLNESYRNQFGEDLPALTDDVRMLFDRMLGSEVAIARAKQTELAIPLFATQEESGLDDDQWAELQEAQRARDEEAIDKFRAQSVRDLKWSRNAQSRAIRKIQREASKRRKEIRSEVEAELRALPVYRAIDFLRKGQLRNEEGDTVEHEGSHRLSIESVKAEFDQDTVDALGYGRNGMLGKEGLHHDLVASVIGGFQDGTDLVRQVAAAKPLKEAVSERAEVVMRERHAELVDPKLIEAAAADSIRNQHHIRFISKTLRFVSRATQPESIMALAAKYAAQKTLERMTIRDIRPDRFSQAERRTGKEANKAWKSGDEALTTNLLRRQLGQAQLANESRVVRADIDKQIKFLRRLARADKRKAVGADYADYIDMVLSKVVVDRVQLAALPERTEPKTLADYASTVQAQGVPTAATPEFLAELNSRPATDYRDMSYEQLLEIVDLVKEIEQRGKIEHQGKLEFLQQSRQEVEGFLTGAVLANAPETKGEPSVTEQSQRFQANRAFYKYGIQQTTMATKAWFMDGGDYGPWFEYMVNTSSKLMDQEIARRAELTKKLEAILMPLFGSPLHGPGPFRDRLNRRMNIQEMFILACNLGNEGNIQRLEEGNGFDINDVMAEVSESLTADQLRAVQDVWDLFTSLKPEVARLERDTRNSEPIWVEPRPITLRSSDGQSVHLRGGYFPIVYDPIASTESMSLKDKEALESEVRQANAASATRQAYTKQRANRVVNRPLLFSMSNIYGSLEEIVHDLTWRKWSLDMNRILSDRSQLSKTILKKYGEIWLRDINDWRNRLIVDDVRAKNDFGGKIVAYTARYASSASLLYNIGSILIQPVGALAIRAATGGRAARAGLAKYLSNPLAAHREAREKSPALELRYLTRMREFADLETRIQGKSGARRTMEAFGWQLMAKTQGIADTIAWHSGYAMAIEKGHSEAKAVDIAYQVVLDTQSSGRTADLSSIETGAPWKRMFAVFYRVMNTQLNLAMRSAKDRNKATASKIVDMAAIFLVMPYVTYLLKDLITPDEEDDPEFWTVEKQAGIIANEAFQSALGSFWFIRDLGSLGNLFEGETPYAYRGPTGLRLIPDFAKLVEQISQGEMDKTLLKSFSTFLGDITGAPAAAINRMIDGFSAMMEGKDVPAYSILTGTQR